MHLGKSCLSLKKVDILGHKEKYQLFSGKDNITIINIVLP